MTKPSSPDPARKSEDRGRSPENHHGNKVTLKELESLKARVKELEAERDGLQGGGNRSGDREAHLKQVLLAIRNVNQLIVAENDLERLIQGACANLTGTLGYHNAWIALLDEGVNVATTASSGFREGFSIMGDRLHRGEFSLCMKRTLKQDELVVIEDPPSRCTDCPLAPHYAGRAGFTRRLSFEGRLYGILSVSVPAAYAYDSEEQGLFKELAGDLGFALHKIEADEQRRRLAHVVATLPQPMSFVSRDYRYLAVNEVYAEIYGVDRDRILGRKVSDFYKHAFFETEIKPMLDRCLAGQIVRYQVQVRFPSKGERWMEMGYFPYRNEKGEITGVVSHGLDITERKHIAQSLHLHSLTLSQIQDIVTVTDLEGHITYVNDAACQMLGKSIEQLIGQHVSAFGEDPSSGASQEEIVGETRRSGSWRGEVVNFREDGSAAILDCRTHVVKDHEGRPVALCGVSTDITERKRTQEALADSERSLRSTLDGLSAHIAVLDEGGEILLVNEAWRRFARQNGTAAEAVSEGANYLRVCDQAAGKDCREAEPFARGVRKVLCGEAPSYALEYPCPSPLEERWFMGRVTPFRGEGERRVVIAHEDITERKLAEEALMLQQRDITLNNRIANVFLTSPPEEIYADVLDVILQALDSRFGYFGYIDDAGNLVCPSMTRGVWDQCRLPEKSIVFPRDAWGGLWGRSLSEKRTLAANEGLHPPEGHVNLQSALAVPIVHHGRLIGQFTVADKPGGYGPRDRKLLESAAAQTAPVLHAMLENARQKRAHEKLEQQYHQAQKLESVGRLAGAVAHDLNNVLSPILGYAEMVLEDTVESDPRKEWLEEIVSAGKRGRDLVRQLLAFSRKQSIELKPVNLNALLKNFEKLLRRTLREDVAVRMVLERALPMVQGDVGQLEQVIMNLVVNAQDAMPDGGELTIETKLAELDEAYVEQHKGTSPGAHAMLAVSDTGFGMDKEVLGRLFEPFFTTKEKGKGTGLGLATVYGIVKQHRGSIWVYSEPGMGATFKIYLPASPDAADTGAHASEGTFSAGVRGSETLLLVEDDDQVRDIASSLLRRRGYAVLTARNGEEALKVLEEHDGLVHLLLTDVIMPGMNGKELFDKASARYPDLRVLYMSGYTDDIIAHHGVLEEGTAFLQKPFSVQSLNGKVREVLERD